MSLTSSCRRTYRCVGIQTSNHSGPLDSYGCYQFLQTGCCRFDTSAIAIALLVAVMHDA